MLNLNKFEDLLNRYDGTTNRFFNIFNYHYDQILREIIQEVSRLPKKEEADLLIDMLIVHMEEFMNWPSNESIEDFKSDLLARKH